MLLDESAETCDMMDTDAALPDGNFLEKTRNVNLDSGS